MLQSGNKLPRVGATKRETVPLLEVQTDFLKISLNEVRTYKNWSIAYAIYNLY
jgi:hypothetical protein